MSLPEWSEVLTEWTIHLGLLGQASFCALFLTRPWRKYRITRAYAAKSLAMLAIFARSEMMLISLGGVRSFNDVPDWVNISAIALNGLVLWAIWYQLIALVLEIKSGRNAADAMLRTQAP